MYAAALSAFLILGFGALRVWGGEWPQEAAAHEAEKAQPRGDRFGDPLPPGAIRRFGTLRFRHQEIGDLAFTPDGKQLIAGGGGCPLAVFDTVTGRKLREVGKHSSAYNAINGFALSGDGKRVACCGSDVFVWEVQTGRLVRQLYCERCQEVAFSPDGTKVATIEKFQQRGAAESQTKVFVVETAAWKRVAEWPLKGLKPLASGFHAIAFSPDGKYLAGIFYEAREAKPFHYRAVSSQVWLFDSSTGARVRTFGLSDVPLICFAFQPGSGRLATLGKDSILRFWDVGTGKEVQHFQAAKEAEGNDFGALRFSADGRRCAVLTNQGKFLTVLDAKDGRVIRRIECEGSMLRIALALSADGETVASARCYDESCVRVWDVASGVERLAEASHRAAVTALCLSADGRTLVSRGGEGRLIHWNIQTGKGDIRSTGTREEVGRFLWSRDGSQRTLRGPRWRMVYKNQRPAMMEVWNLDGTKLLRKAEVSTWINAETLSSDGRQLAVVTFPGANSTILVWEPEREEKPRRLQGLPGYCGQLLFSHDGKRLIATSGESGPRFLGAMWIWDVATAQVVHQLTTKSVPGRRLLLTSNDRVLLIGGLGDDATVHAWDMETGKEFAALADPSLKIAKSEESGVLAKPAITALALSADERFLAVVTSRGDTSAVSVWETGSWKLVKAFAPTGPRNDANAMIFSPDGRSLFVANSDSTILAWDVTGRVANGRRQPAGGAPNQDRLNHLWRTLAEMPDKAYPAVWELLDHPAESAPFLIGKLPPVPPVEKRVRQLLGQLDSDSFPEREEASRQLSALGENVEPLLRQALTERPSLEVKKRVEGILESLPHGPSPEQLRLLRALAVLEWCGMAEVEAHLRRLAEGAPSASLTRAAKAARQRLKRGEPSEPRP